MSLQFNELQLISALLILSMRVIPSLLLHVIAREYDLAIWPLSLACLSDLWAAYMLHGYPTDLWNSWDLAFWSTISKVSPAILSNTCLCTVPLLIYLSPFLPEPDSDFWLRLCSDATSRDAVQNKASFIPSNLVARECQPCCPDGYFYLSTIVGWILGLSSGQWNGNALSDLLY